MPAGTARVVADKLRDKGESVGVLKIRLFRPFPHQQIAKILKSAKKIAVMDRSISLGAYPPIYSEIAVAINTFNKQNSCKTKIISFVYGLGGRDLFQKDIEKVFKELNNNYFPSRI